MAQNRPWVIAHRGATLEAPENTLAAFRRAIALGADLIELDVHQTADGHLVVIHDETVDRTTNGSGLVRDMTLREVCSLDAGSWLGAGFSGERVPMLSEVLELTGGKIGLAIEIKAGSSRYPNIEASIVQRLQRAERLDDIIIISGDCQAIKAIRRLEGRLATACFEHGSPRHWAAYARRSDPAEGWHSDYLLAWPEELTTAVVEEVHANGLGIVTSLERMVEVDQAEIRRLIRTGVDGILADDVDQLVRLVAEENRT